MNTTMKERIMKIVKEIMQSIERKETAWIWLWSSVWTICSLAMIELLSQFFDKATIFTTIVFVTSTTAIGRIMYYFMKTKQAGRKHSFLSFIGAIYTQEDFENFRHGLSEELYKEMKNNAYIEISTEKEELERKRAKMKAFLRKHNSTNVVFDEDEENTLVDAALSVTEVEEAAWNFTLKDIVIYFDLGREKFIALIQSEAEGKCMLSYLMGGLAFFYFCKKALKDFRKKLHKAYYNEKCSGIMLYEYRKEEEQLAGENEATFRC